MIVRFDDRAADLFYIGQYKFRAFIFEVNEHFEGGSGSAIDRPMCLVPAIETSLSLAQSNLF